jgi:hypothetical protein
MDDTLSKHVARRLDGNLLEVLPWTNNKHEHSSLRSSSERGCRIRKPEDLQRMQTHVSIANYWSCVPTVRSKKKTQSPRQHHGSSSSGRTIAPQGPIYHDQRIRSPHHRWHFAHIAMGEGRCRNEAGMLMYYEARQASRRGTLHN